MTFDEFVVELESLVDNAVEADLSVGQIMAGLLIQAERMRIIWALDVEYQVVKRLKSERENQS